MHAAFQVLIVLTWSISLSACVCVCVSVCMCTHSRSLLSFSAGLRWEVPLTVPPEEESDVEVSGQHWPQWPGLLVDLAL